MHHELKHDIVNHKCLFFFQLKRQNFLIALFPTWVSFSWDEILTKNNLGEEFCSYNSMSQSMTEGNHSRNSSRDYGQMALISLIALACSQPAFLYNKDHLPRGDTAHNGLGHDISINYPPFLHSSLKRGHLRDFYLIFVSLSINTRFIFPHTCLEQRQQRECGK